MLSVSKLIKIPQTPVQIEGTSFYMTDGLNVRFLSQSIGSENVKKLIEKEKELIEDTFVGVSKLYPKTNFKQIVVFCESDFYKFRLTLKGKMYNFDPLPWVDWSEGDSGKIEIEGKTHEVFFIKLGADFFSGGDKKRFLGHEMTHPRLCEISPLLTTLNNEALVSILDIEGIAEADQRIAQGLQYRPDMQESTVFIAKLELVPANELLELKYNHPKFLGITVSKNPGYATCFLWVYGMSEDISTRLGFSGGLTERYLKARQIILDTYRKAGKFEDYKYLLRTTAGFDYDTALADPKFLESAKQKFIQEFAPNLTL